MVDLQRSIGHNEMPFAAGCKTVPENSDLNASTDSNCSQKFSAENSGENIIRSN